MEEADAGQDGEAAAGAPPVASLDLTHVRGFQILPSSGDTPPDAVPLDEEERRRELAKEFTARAARFAEAVDDAIVLANDGAIRWLGDPVAKLISGEETLKPRAVLLADDALPPEGREAAQQRVALWLAAHVRKALGPLLALVEPESVPENVRDLALKLSQSLGILERERVKTQVKALDQNARGALRKLGVRFGAHYVYVPALLKPGARALCAQLWALSRGEADKEAVADKLLHFASSGRTSFAVEPPASAEVYRVAGFRLCGDRAVRVDIVERLTDLIRAALPRHAEAAPQDETSLVGFVVTNQMTSLTGCSGEHFASILRSLGFANYQVKKVAYLAAQKAAQPASVEPVAAAPAPALEEPTAATPAPQDEEGAAASAPEAAEALPNEDGQPLAAQDQAVSAESEPVEPPASEDQSEPEDSEPAPALEAAASGDEEDQEAAQEAASVVETASGDDEAPAESSQEVASTVETATSGDDEAPAEPPQEVAATVEAAASGDVDELIEIWRPAPRRPRQSGRDHGRPHRHAQAGAPAEGGRAAHDGQPRKPWRDRPRPAAQPEAGRADEAQSAAPRPSGEPGREGRRQPWRRDGAKGPRPDEKRHVEAGADKAKTRPQPEQRKPSVNLDSPFAKLLDLKPLLKSRDTAK